MTNTDILEYTGAKFNLSTLYTIEVHIRFLFTSFELKFSSTKIPEHAKSIYGDTLGHPIRLEFSTPIIQYVKFIYNEKKYWDGEKLVKKLPCNSKFFIQFDQPIIPEQVMNCITFWTDSGDSLLSSD